MKRRLPPLNALRSFEAAARLGRMTTAADELSVTPGAISRQVQLLEQHVGQPLFAGSKNKPHLTPAGKTLLPALSAALDSIEAILQTVSDSALGTIDVACFSTFTVKWLIPRLFDFNARHPGIEVRLRTSSPQGNLERVRSDLVIDVEEDGVTSSEASEEMLATIGPKAGIDEADTLALFPEYLGPVIAPQLADRLALRTPADLSAHTMLQSKTRLNAWQMWANAQPCNLPVANGTVFEHYFFTLQAAAAGLGICVAPWHLVADDVQAGRLLAPLGFCKSGYRYVARRRPQRNQKLDLFFTWLQAQASQFPSPPVLSR